MLTLALSLDPKEIINSLSPYGEIGLMLIIFAETGLLFGFFLPGDSLLFTAGLLAQQGKLNLAVVLVGCFAAAVIGDQVGFTIGQKAGPRIFSKPESRLFKQEFVERTEHFFEKHGPKTVFLARFIAGLRVVAAWIAGITHMRWRTFLLWNALGGIVWAFGYGLLAYYFGKALVDAISTYGLYAAVVIAVVVVAGFFGYRWWKRRRASAKRVAEEQVVVVAAERKDAGPTHDVG